MSPTDGRTDPRTDGQTHSPKEMRKRIYNIENNNHDKYNDNNNINKNHDSNHPQNSNNSDAENIEKKSIKKQRKIFGLETIFPVFLRLITSFSSVMAFRERWRRLRPVTSGTTAGPTETMSPRASSIPRGIPTPTHPTWTAPTTSSPNPANKCSWDSPKSSAVRFGSTWSVDGFLLMVFVNVYG